MNQIQWRDQLHSSLVEGREARKPLLLYFWTPE